MWFHIDLNDNSAQTLGEINPCYIKNPNCTKPAMHRGDNEIKKKIKRNQSKIKTPMSSKNNLHKISTKTEDLAAIIDIT